jgi:hypothetical protein
MQKKVLVLGTNDYTTDNATSLLASKHKSVNHGIVSDSESVPRDLGFYHSTILDLNSGQLINLSRHFDLVIMLDQPQSAWSHWKPLLSTYKVMCEIENLGIPTEFRNNKNIQGFESFSKLVIENKSFCIYPWIQFNDKKGCASLCARSTGYPIKQTNEIADWKNDPEFSDIRTKMLAGEKLPNCHVCYDYEDKGIESYRQFETKDWIGKLGIHTVEQLHEIDKPYFYELELNNICNVMCRSCSPAYSHLIAKEAIDNNIIASSESVKRYYSNIDIVNIKTLCEKSRVYLQGGEPTIMPEVLAFLHRCIEQNKTDFDLTMCTNGQHLSKSFINAINQFSNVNFSISLDGYGPVNNYWRHGTDWDIVIANAKFLQSLGHNISINTVPGIYNVSNLHLLFEFLEREFPHCGIYLQINNNDYQSAYNFPIPELVVTSMERCKRTSVYYSDGKSNKTCIDSLHEYYSKNPQCNLTQLKKFFDRNDELDKIRGVYLRDYVPELDGCRELL